MLSVAAVGAMLGALPASSLMGQSLTDASYTRMSGDMYFSELRVPEGDGSLETDGIGARVMWNGASVFGPASILARRTEYGVYGVFDPKQRLRGDQSLTAIRLGVRGTVRLLQAPLVGWFDPIASLGTGLWHSSASGPVTTHSPLLSGSVTTWELTPGLGLRVAVGPGMAIQGDLQEALTFSSGVQHTLALALGVRFDL